MLSELRADRAPSRAVRLAAATVMAFCVGLFLLVAEDVLDGGGLISRDAAVLGWFVEHRGDTWITVARWSSTLLGFGGLCVLALVLTWWLRRRAVPPALAAAPLAALLLGGLAAVVAKAVFGRERPPLVLHATSVGLAAFPSAHATDAAAFFVAASLVVCLTVVHRRGRQLLVLAGGVALAGLVGVSRLVLAVHWLSDVVAGWALGTAVAVAVVLGAWLVVAGGAAATVAVGRGAGRTPPGR